MKQCRTCTELVKAWNSIICHSSLDSSSAVSTSSALVLWSSHLYVTSLWHASACCGLELFPFSQGYHFCLVVASVLDSVSRESQPSDHLWLQERCESQNSTPSHGCSRGRSRRTKYSTALMLYSPLKCMYTVPTVHAVIALTC